MDFTPAPWHVAQANDVHIGPVINHHTHRVAAVVYAGDTEQANANARLIAAAPDLLAALIELVERCDGADGVRADDSNIQTMQAHAAIAKATVTP